jgi:large conductance mechanosensitive channel
MADVIKGFRAFVLRGNVVELAVALIMALAFVAVVNSLVENLLTPIIAVIFGEPSLSSLDFEINDSVFRYGAFLDSLAQFLMIAFAVYFFVVLPYGQVNERLKRGEEPDPTTKVCPECLSTIPVEARRCAFCAQPVTA